MARAKIVRDSEERLYGIFVECPGCNAHVLPVRPVPAGEVESPSVQGKPHWDFNWNLDLPTFSPSILSRASDLVCHSFVRDGRIQFLGDCTHKLANQTVDLPEVSGG